MPKLDGPMMRIPFRRGLGDQRVRLGVDVDGGDHDRATDPFVDAVVDRPLQRGSRNGDHGETDLVRDVGDRCVRLLTADAVVRRVDGEDRHPGVPADVASTPSDRRSRDVRRPDDGDRGRQQQPGDGT